MVFVESPTANSTLKVFPFTVNSIVPAAVTPFAPITPHSDWLPAEFYKKKNALGKLFTSSMLSNSPARETSTRTASNEPSP